MELTSGAQQFQVSTQTCKPQASRNYDCGIRPCHWVYQKSLTKIHRADSWTSGTGYIGSFTVLALLEADYKVIIADNLYNSSEEVINRIELISGKRPHFYNVDIRKQEDFDKVFKAHPDIDSVIHFAALKVRREQNPLNTWMSLKASVRSWVIRTNKSIV